VFLRKPTDSRPATKGWKNTHPCRYNHPGDTKGVDMCQIAEFRTPSANYYLAGGEFPAAGPTDFTFFCHKSGFPQLLRQARQQSRWGAAQTIQTGISA